MNPRAKIAILLLLLTIGSGAIVAVRVRRQALPIKRSAVPAPAVAAAPKADAPVPALPSFDPAPAPAPVPAKAAPVDPAAPAPEAAKPGEKDGTATVTLQGMRFTIGGGAKTGELTDADRYPGMAVLKQELQLTDAQEARMSGWLKQRDVAYQQLDQITDPAQYAAHGQSVKASYENAFRSELSSTQQSKYDELQKSGAFSFRGPPDPPAPQPK